MILNCVKLTIRAMAKIMGSFGALHALRKPQAYAHPDSFLPSPGPLGATVSGSHSKAESRKGKRQISQLPSKADFFMVLMLVTNAATPSRGP